MSKEAAAAILAKVYFDKVSGPSTVLIPERPGNPDVALDCVDQIGSVYAAFLGHHRAFEILADTEFRSNNGGDDSSLHLTE